MCLIFGFWSSFVRLVDPCDLINTRTGLSSCLTCYLFLRSWGPCDFTDFTGLEPGSSCLTCYYVLSDLEILVILVMPGLDHLYVGFIIVVGSRDPFDFVNNSSRPFACLACYCFLSEDH